MRGPASALELVTGSNQLFCNRLTERFTSNESPRGNDAYLELSSVVENTKKLIDEARKNKVPVIFTAIAYRSDMLDAGLWGQKIPGLKIMVTIGCKMGWKSMSDCR